MRIRRSCRPWPNDWHRSSAWRPVRICRATAASRSGWAMVSRIPLHHRAEVATQGNSPRAFSLPISPEEARQPGGSGPSSLPLSFPPFFAALALPPGHRPTGDPRSLTVCCRRPRSIGAMAGLPIESREAGVRRIPKPLSISGVPLLSPPDPAACAARRDVLGLITQCSDVHAQLLRNCGRVKTQPKWRCAPAGVPDISFFAFYACSSTGRAPASKSDG